MGFEVSWLTLARIGSAYPFRSSKSFAGNLHEHQGTSKWDFSGGQPEKRDRKRTKAFDPGDFDVDDSVSVPSWPIVAQLTPFQPRKKPKAANDNDRRRSGYTKPAAKPAGAQTTPPAIVRRLRDRLAAMASQLRAVEVRLVPLCPLLA